MRKFLQELELVPIPQRVTVFEYCARDLLLHQGVNWLAEHPNVEPAERWNRFKRFIIQEFISPNPADFLKSELTELKRTPFDTLVSFNRKFRTLATQAYPEPRNEDQEEILIQTYAQNLVNSSLARKVIKPEWPATLDIAMERITRKELEDENMKRLKLRDGEELMEVDAAETISGILGTAKKNKTSKGQSKGRPKSTTSDADTQDLKKELCDITRQCNRLEKKLHLCDDLKEKIDQLTDIITAQQKPQPAFVPTSNWTPSPQSNQRRPDALQCWYCQKVGHYERDCRKKAHDQQKSRAEQRNREQNNSFKQRGNQMASLAMASSKTQ
jgi:hypothetical protein